MSRGHLDQLLLGIADAQLAATSGIGHMVVSGLTLDSRRVHRGDAFFALRGMHGHGIEFAAGAVQRGAQIVLAEAPQVDTVALGVPVLWVENLHEQVGEIAAHHWCHWHQWQDVHRAAAGAGTCPVRSWRRVHWNLGCGSARAFAGRRAHHA